MSKERYQAVTRIKVLNDKAREAMDVLDNYRNAVIDLLQSDNAEVSRLTAELADRTRSEQDYREQMDRLADTVKYQSDQLAVKIDELSRQTKLIVKLKDDLFLFKMCLWVVIAAGVLSRILEVVL